MIDPRISRSSYPLLLGLLAAAITLGLFAKLASEMAEGETMQIDGMLRQIVHAFASPALTEAMRVFTFLGSVLFVTVASIAVAFLLWRMGHPNRAVLILISVAGGGLLMSVLKLLYHRPRPMAFFGTLAPETYSFPSGHATVSFCFYLAMAALLTAREPRLWVRVAAWAAAILLVLAIGISRVYLGVHYPSDVLAGYLAALFWVTGVAVAYRALQARRQRRNSS